MGTTCQKSWLPLLHWFVWTQWVLKILLCEIHNKIKQIGMHQGKEILFPGKKKWLKETRHKKPAQTPISDLWLWQRRLGTPFALSMNSLACSQAYRIPPQVHPINLLSSHSSKQNFLHMKQVTSDCIHKLERGEGKKRSKKQLLKTRGEKEFTDARKKIINCHTMSRLIELLNPKNRFEQLSHILQKFIGWQRWTLKGRTLIAIIGLFGLRGKGGGVE